MPVEIHLLCESFGCEVILSMFFCIVQNVLCLNVGYFDLRTSDTGNCHIVVVTNDYDFDF